MKKLCALILCVVFMIVFISNMNSNNQLENINMPVGDGNLDDPPTLVPYPLSVEFINFDII